MAGRTAAGHRQGPGDLDRPGCGPHEGVGPRVRHRPDEVEGVPDRAGKVQLPVLRPASAEIGGRAQGPLGDPLGGPVDQARPRGSDQLPARGGRLQGQAQGRLVPVDGEFGLADDVAVVGLGGHGVQGDPGPGLAPDQDPVDGSAAPVVGQERTMQVVGAQARQFQESGLDHLAEVETEEEVRPKPLDPLEYVVLVEAGLQVDRDAMLPGQIRRGDEPCLVGALRIGVECQNLDARLQEAGQGLPADRGIGANDCRGHGAPPKGPV